MTEATEKDREIAQLRQELEAHEAVIASLATQLILGASDKHRMLEDVFSEALEQVDHALPHGAERDAVKDRVHELADRVQHGE
jgi:hypothetical protein